MALSENNIFTYTSDEYLLKNIFTLPRFIDQIKYFSDWATRQWNDSIKDTTEYNFPSLLAKKEKKKEEKDEEAETSYYGMYKAFVLEQLTPTGFNSDVIEPYKKENSELKSKSNDEIKEDAEKYTPPSLFAFLDQQGTNLHDLWMLKSLYDKQKKAEKGEVELNPTEKFGLGFFNTCGWIQRAMYLVGPASIILAIALGFSTGFTLPFFVSVGFVFISTMIYFGPALLRLAASIIWNLGYKFFIRAFLYNTVYTFAKIAFMGLVTAIAVPGYNIFCTLKSWAISLYNAIKNCFNKQKSNSEDKTGVKNPEVKKEDKVEKNENKNEELEKLIDAQKEDKKEEVKAEKPTFNEKFKNFFKRVWEWMLEKFLPPIDFFIVQPFVNFGRLAIAFVWNIVINGFFINLYAIFKEEILNQKFDYPELPKLKEEQKDEKIIKEYLKEVITNVEKGEKDKQNITNNEKKTADNKRIEEKKSENKEQSKKEEEIKVDKKENEQEIKIEEPKKETKETVVEVKPIMQVKPGEEGKKDELTVTEDKKLGKNDKEEKTDLTKKNEKPKVEEKVTKDNVVVISELRKDITGKIQKKEENGQEKPEQEIKNLEKK